MANIIPLLTLLPPPRPPDFLYLPASEQPAQRLMDASAEALPDDELLSLVLGNKTPEQSLGLSRRLRTMFGSLRELATLPLAELLMIATGNGDEPHRNDAACFAEEPHPAIPPHRPRHHSGRHVAHPA